MLKGEGGITIRDHLRNRKRGRGKHSKGSGGLKTTDRGKTVSDMYEAKKS